MQEAAAVEAAAPPHCGAELLPQGEANEAEDLPPEYEPTEDPQAAMIRQLQGQMAAMQQQFHAEASISSDNVPAPVSRRPGEASSCP